MCTAIATQDFEVRNAGVRFKDAIVPGTSRSCDGAAGWLPVWAVVALQPPVSTALHGALAHDGQADDGPGGQDSQPGEGQGQNSMAHG